LILWGLTILVAFNTIVFLKLLANVANVSVKILPGLDITVLALILVLLIVVNILTLRKWSKLIEGIMERTCYTLPIAILASLCSSLDSKLYTEHTIP